MVKVTLNDRKFSVKGTFDFGYIGLIKDDMLYIDIEDDILENRECYWDEFSAIFNIKDKSDEAIAEAITVYVNNLEAKVQKNIKQINDNLLAHIAENWEACAYPFWDERLVKGMLIPEFLPNDENVYTDEVLSILYDIESVLDTPNDGSMEKMDVEATMRKIFPMFNWDKFLSSIKPCGVSLDYYGHLRFECSDTCGLNILCSAFAELDDELRFTRWDNF